MEKNKYIQIAIKLSGQSSTKIAEQIGVSKAQVTNWVSGFRSPGEQNIATLAKALDVDEAWIAGYPGTVDTKVYASRKATKRKAAKRKALRLHIMKTLHIEDYGTLYQAYHFESDLLLSFILTEDGMQFFTRDIDDPQPKTQAGIDAVEWISPDGSIIAKMDGLPRILI